MSEYYFVVHVYYIFSVHFSVEGHLICFQVLAIVNSAAMTLGYITCILLDKVFLLMHAQEWDYRIIW